MSDGFGLQRTCADASYDEWLQLCTLWWDQMGTEEVLDYPHLPWDAWYSAGLTVDQAVRMAHRETFGVEPGW